MPLLADEFIWLFHSPWYGSVVLRSVCGGQTVDVILNGELQEVIEAFEAEEFNTEWQSTEKCANLRLY